MNSAQPKIHPCIRCLGPMCLGILLIIVANGCTPPPSLKTAHYWQRVDASSAIWMRGPKAQQKLHKDITGCVNELNELERLGTVRWAMPADPYSDPVSPEGQMAQWETPERDGALYAEHSDYHDFETCMRAHGWQRVDMLPYNQAETAREYYRRNVVKYRHRSKHGERSQDTIHRAPNYTTRKSSTPDSDGLND